MTSTLSAIALLVLTLALPSVAAAQAAPAGQAGATGTSPWSFDASIGWDPSIGGAFLDDAIGTFGTRGIVIDRQNWGDIYGTGLLFNAAVGYALGERAELRGGFNWQSNGSKENLIIGTLAGQDFAFNVDNYQAWSIDGGYRMYFAERAERLRPYVGGSLGFGQVKDIEADVLAGSVVANDTLFYEGNGTFVFGLNGGVLYRLTERLALDGRLGLRYTSGMSDLNDELFTGLDDANNDSSRWSLPITVGLRVQF